MRILFASTLSYNPQYYCGANISIHENCLALMARGHSTSVLVALRPGGWFAFVSRIKGFIRGKLFGCKVSRDSKVGYPVWRAWFPTEAMDYVIRQEKPDVIVIVAGQIVSLALAAKKSGIPVCMGLTDIEFHLHGGSFESLGNIPCIANSNFTANVYQSKYGVTSFLSYPGILAAKYRTDTTRQNITFINPHPEKGIVIALEIAKNCPDIPFAFYKTWVLSEAQERELTENLSRLPNVKLFEAQDDMKKVYGKCKILLAPSIWQETYGRVATEAQLSGIPVVASTRGGLPEAVGPGGVIIDPAAPINDWISAVRRLWDDKQYYAELSAAALAHAQRPEMDFDCKMDGLEKFLLSLCNSPTAPTT